jgi:hypothetical protein
MMAQVIQRDEVIGAQEGDLRVWWIRNVPNYPHYTIVSCPAAARQRLNDYAFLDLEDKLVTSNAGGLEVYEGDEWHEWYDENGHDINRDVNQEEHD